MKASKAQRFFSDGDKDRIRQAVGKAEAMTSGEIVTMIVDQSDGYHDGEVLGSVIVAGMAALIISAGVHYGGLSYHIPLDMTIWSYVPLVFILYFPFRFIFSVIPWLKLPFINKNRIMNAVRERAVRAFFEKRLYKTRDENGILIFISLLERKVWILGDRGIDTHIGNDTWMVMAREVSAGIGKGRGCDALCSVIGQIGELLARHFPRRSGDVNELTDELLL